MADETITIEPTGQTAQVDSLSAEPQAPVEVAPVADSTTIAPRTDTHGDQIQKQKKPSLFTFLRDLFTKAQPVAAEQEPDSEPVELFDDPPATSNFTVWKEANGQYRWLAIYSNQFRDHDSPPEIISEQSHKSFVELVDDGALPYPELWHWHLPGTRWGQADMLDYADGFAVASGTVDAGHEKEAEALSQMDDIRVSHGMPSRFIVRNKQDSSIIEFHVTSEISPLPGWAAANPLTQFVVLNKEYEMALSPEKRMHLEAVGLKPEVIAELEAGLASQKEAAVEAGLESKESTEQPVAAETPVTPVPAYATQQEVADAVSAIVTPLAEALNNVNAQLAALSSEVKALKETDQEKVAKAAAGTPRASLQDLIAKSLQGMGDAQIDGRTALAKASPKQAPADSITPVPFLDALMRQAQGVQQ